MQVTCLELGQVVDVVVDSPLRVRVRSKLDDTQVNAVQLCKHQHEGKCCCDRNSPSAYRMAYARM